MTDRLDRFTIALHGRSVTIDWHTQQALMARMQHVGTRARLRADFEAVGTTRPLEPTRGQRAALLQVLEDWSVADDDYPPMPAQLLALRDALRDEVGPE